ncbi:STAS-like domain-containing protein [Bacillus cereus]|nr:STAS-like domain-containing protein [Bacillus cereus]MEB9569687.1 STAS-like domain-containing protein [Bacillus cereus]
MVTINVLNHVEGCYSNDDGYVILNLIKKAFKDNKQVTVSFEGVNSVTSSFVNSAFIELLNWYDFNFIRSNLHFTNSTKQINSTIKHRFQFETSQKKEVMMA